MTITQDGARTTSELERRDLLRRSFFWGSAAVAGSLAVAAPAHADSPHVTVFDVAMLGNTHRLIPGPGVEDFDLRGTTYYVDGIIYPGGTITGGAEIFDPAAHADQAIGTWISTGSFIWSPGRLQPHRFSIQQHIFGTISPADLFPEDQIASQGTESSRTQDTLPSTRVITGGSGKYFGASGQITQYGHGKNNTLINVLGQVQTAPNFRMHFKFKS